MKKPAETKMKILSIIAERWSSRAFDSNRKVEDTKIVSICEAAQWAPSSAGEEPWRFIIFNKFNNKNAWDKAINCLDKYNKIWAENAPVLITGITHSKWNDSPDKINKWAGHDLGAASENLHLESVNQGLITHPMGGFDNDKFRNEFALPIDYEILTLIAIGYPGELSTLDEFNRERETEKRKRKEFGDLFFDGEWGNPLLSD
jgi:nitroreductase